MRICDFRNLVIVAACGIGCTLTNVIKAEAFNTDGWNVYHAGNTFWGSKEHPYTGTYNVPKKIGYELIPNNENPPRYRPVGIVRVELREYDLRLWRWVLAPGGCLKFEVAQMVGGSCTGGSGVFFRGKVGFVRTSEHEDGFFTLENATSRGEHWLSTEWPTMTAFVRSGSSGSPIGHTVHIGYMGDKPREALIGDKQLNTGWNLQNYYNGWNVVEHVSIPELPKYADDNCRWDEFGNVNNGHPFRFIDFANVKGMYCSGTCPSPEPIPCLPNEYWEPATCMCVAPGSQSGLAPALLSPTIDGATGAVSFDVLFEQGAQVNISSTDVDVITTGNVSLGNVNVVNNGQNKWRIEIDVLSGSGQLQARILPGSATSPFGHPSSPSDYTPIFTIGTQIPSDPNYALDLLPNTEINEISTLGLPVENLQSSLQPDLVTPHGLWYKANANTNMLNTFELYSDNSTSHGIELFKYENGSYILLDSDIAFEGNNASVQTVEEGLLYVYVASSEPNGVMNLSRVEDEAPLLVPNDYIHVTGWNPLHGDHYVFGKTLGTENYTLASVPSCMSGTSYERWYRFDAYGGWMHSFEFGSSNAFSIEAFKAINGELIPVENCTLSSYQCPSYFGCDQYAAVFYSPPSDNQYYFRVTVNADPSNYSNVPIRYGVGGI